MAIVIYNSCAVIPAPFVTINSTVVNSPDQRRLGKTYQLTINGTLVSFKGSPQAGTLTGGSWGGPNNLFWQGTGYPPDEAPLIAHKLFATEVKQSALEDLFSTDGAWLEFESPDGSAPLKCQPKNFQITYTEDDWVNTCKYTITCEADVLYMVNGEVFQGIGFSELIQSANESWDIQPAEAVKTFAVAHTVNAVGKRMFDSLGNEVQSPWQNAKDFVNQNLVLGFNGASAFSSNAGQAIFNMSSLGSGIINFSSLSSYDFSRVENIDELGGSYSVTENWVLATGSGTDIYNVSVQQIVDEPYTTKVATIQGTLKGFYSQLFDYDKRILSAEWMWSQLQGAPLFNRILSYVGTTYASGFNQQPILAVLDYNPQEGTLSYNYEFNNRLYFGDAFESYVISRKSAMEDYKSSFSIQGNIKGRRYETDIDPRVSFTRAHTLWEQIYPNQQPDVFYNRIVSTNFFPEASGMGLQFSPVSKNIDMNEAQGEVTYAFDFNTRSNTDNGFANIAEETYSISQHFSREEAYVAYSIQGTIQGLNVTDVSPQFNKYQNANVYWLNHALPNLYSRVTGVYGNVFSNSLPQVEEVEKNPSLGNITYNFQYTTIPAPIISGVLSEVITITENNASGNVNVFANIPIISRIQGPILQNMNTTPAKQRGLSIETVVAATGGFNLLAAFNLRPNYDQYVAQLVPANSYTESDTNSWNFKMGRYSRNVSWIYV